MQGHPRQNAGKRLPLARSIGAAAAAGLTLVGGFILARASRDEVACGEGFYPVAARCCPGPLADSAGCVASASCPSPLVLRGKGCDAPDERVTIPETRISLGPSDWEAEGRVAPREVHAGPFQLDAFEVTVGHFEPQSSADPTRAANELTRGAAEAYCRTRGGRLPTEDEWIVAAAGASHRRYPWGETGAVCRRAAWGLASGPCSIEGNGPDTVGAHVSGDTLSGLHDMAGNVAEWVAPDPSSPGVGVARGGSWRSALASELRTWSRLELGPEDKDARVGVRCAYDLR
jgi:formylglycine-generating enzyme required for sulfatase activity